jgi:hypothetical protein
MRHTFVSADLKELKYLRKIQKIHRDIVFTLTILKEDLSWEKHWYLAQGI